MVFHYRPIIRWKRGERVGIRHLSNAAKVDVYPLILIGPDQYRSRQPTASKPAVTAAQALAQELLQDWGTSPFYLGAAMLTLAAGASHHPLVDIAAACRALGMQLIPATRLDAPTSYQQAVWAVVQVDQRGVCLRTDLQGVTSANAWVANWPYNLAITDLIADFGDNVANVVALGQLVDQAFQTLFQGPQWRSVTTAGTSMPGNFGGFVAGLHRIRRVEFDLWRHLTQVQLPYRLDYGDYATVATVPPPPGIAWGYPISVRYTLIDDFLICRGVGTTGLGGVDMDQQLQGHAQAIVAYPQRSPLPCWADARIDAIAAGAEEPSGLEHWVRIGVNRHVERVRTDLP